MNLLICTIIVFAILITTAIIENAIGWSVIAKNIRTHFKTKNIVKINSKDIEEIFKYNDVFKKSNQNVGTLNSINEDIKNEKDEIEVFNGKIWVSINQVLNNISYNE